VQNATTNSNRLDVQTNGGMAQGREAGDAASKDIIGLQSTRMADAQSMKETQDAQDQIAAHPDLMGTTLTSRATRALAEMGIAGDSNALSALQKMTADQRNAYVKTLAGGSMGFARSNAELNTLSQAVADVKTNPKAANWILQLQQDQIKQREDWRDRVSELQDTSPAEAVGVRYFRQKDQFAKSWLSEHELPDYGGATPQTPATPAPSTPAQPTQPAAKAADFWSK
jgi:hypothetical protein